MHTWGVRDGVRVCCVVLRVAMCLTTVCVSACVYGVLCCVLECVPHHLCMSLVSRLHYEAQQLPGAITIVQWASDDEVEVDSHS
jgi:hypothetical protein